VDFKKFICHTFDKYYRCGPPVDLTQQDYNYLIWYVIDWATKSTCVYIIFVIQENKYMHISVINNLDKAMDYTPQ